MTQSDKDGRTARATNAAQTGRAPKSAAKRPGELPGWTSGLRQLYDQVVDEDLPDSFRDLIARLDDPR